MIYVGFKGVKIIEACFCDVQQRNKLSKYFEVELSVSITSTCFFFSLEREREREDEVFLVTKQTNQHTQLAERQRKKKNLKKKQQQKTC